MDYIVLHRMQKVASQTIYHSLRHAAPHLTIEQAHFLTPQAIATIRERAALPDVRPDDAASLLRQIEVARRCGAEIERRRKLGLPYCVLSGYRDPLDQVISQLFQNLPNWFPEVDVNSPEPAVQAAFIEQKLKHMFRRLHVERQPVTTVEERRFASVLVRGLEWFDREFRPVHGIDLYEHRPDEHGLFVIDRGPVRHIVFRQETLRTHFPVVMAQVPGVHCRQRIDSNEAEKKKIGELYRIFRQRFQPTAAMHDFYYTSRYFRHFYRDAAPHFARPTADSDSLAELEVATAQLLRVNAAEQRLARRLLEQKQTTQGGSIRNLLHRLFR